MTYFLAGFLPGSSGLAFGGRPIVDSSILFKVSGGYKEPRKIGSIFARLIRCWVVFFDKLNLSANSSRVQPFASIVNFREILKKSKKKRHFLLDISVI